MGKRSTWATRQAEIIRDVAWLAMNMRVAADEWPTQASRVLNDREVVLDNLLKEWNYLSTRRRTQGKLWR